MHPKFECRFFTALYLQREKVKQSHEEEKKTADLEMSKARLQCRQLMHSLSDPDLHDYQVWKNSVFKYMAVYSKESLLLGKPLKAL